jgi:hypothetical protein
MAKATKWLLLLALGAAAVWGIGKGIDTFFSSGSQTSAGVRVATLLANCRRNGDMSTAVSMWDGTSPSKQTQDSYNAGAQGLTAWLAEKGIAFPISTYRLVEVVVERVDSVDAPGRSVVRCEIDGRAASIRATEGKPLEWVP